jgi:D-alanyl-D-alanine carboxypeptidase (penicillin-binding protein 5/6)
MFSRRTIALLVLAGTAAAGCSSGRGAGSTDTLVGLPGATSVPESDPSGTAPAPGPLPPPSAAVATTATPATAAASTTTAPPTSPAPTTSPPTTAPPATTAAPSTTFPAVDVKAYAVYDMQSGRLLAKRRASDLLPVGSLMKLLTAYVAYAAGEPTKIVKVPDNLLQSPDESAIGLVPGEKFQRDLLIRAMLIVSANDAARALAKDIAGGEAAYAEVMNAAAAELGLANTHAANVTGLDARGQGSSALDMIKLGVRLMANPSFQLNVRRPDAVLHELRYPTTNDLINIYPGADGIKSGHTSQAGWCLLGSATRDGRRIVVAVLGAPTEQARNDAATRLLDWGFTQ